MTPPFGITSRRYFFIALGSIGFGLLCGGLLRFGWQSDSFENETVGADLISSPPRKLEASELGTLWMLLVLINEGWNLLPAGEVERLKPKFHDFISLRSEKDPSYAEEYRNASKIILINLTDRKRVLRDLLKPQGTTESEEYTRLGHFRKYVVQEFSGFLMMAGGFRRFGLKNYPGHVGGVFSEHPYR